MSHRLFDARHIRGAGSCVGVPKGMFASESSGVDFALPALQLRALARRAALPAVLAIAAVGAVLLLQSRVLVLAGTALALGLVGNDGPRELSAIAAVAAALGIVLCLILAARHGDEPGEAKSSEVRDGRQLGRITASARLAGGAVRDALGLLR